MSKALPALHGEGMSTYDDVLGRKRVDQIFPRKTPHALSTLLVVSPVKVGRRHHLVGHAGT